MTDVKRLLDEATQLPWRLVTDKSEPEGPYPVGIEHDHGGYPGHEGWVVRFDDDWSTDQWRNGELIVYAVNTLPDYEAAVDLLAEAIPFMEDEWIGTEGPIGDGGDWIEKARAALRRLRGESDV